MKAPRLFGELFLILCLLLGAVLVVGESLTSDDLEESLLEVYRQEKLASLQLGASRFEAGLQRGEHATELLKSISEHLHSPILWVDEKAGILAGSLETPSLEPIEGDELQSALAGQAVAHWHHLTGKKALILRLAVPLEEGGALVASLDRKDLSPSLERPWLGWILLAVALVMGWALRVKLMPLGHLEERARALAEGEPIEIEEAQGSAELEALGLSLNHIALRQDRKEQNQKESAREAEAIFQGIGEGLILLDLKGNLLRMNPAAVRLLAIEGSWKEGGLLSTQARSHGLNSMVANLRRTGEPQEERLEIFSNGKELEARADYLMGPQGKPERILVLLHDQTRLLKLERVRKEFVSNVSHELKTPITSIAGYAETLFEEVRDTEGPLVKFSEVILRQSRSLQLLVEDLLQLARLEEEGYQRSVEPKSLDVAELFAGVRQLCQHKAAEKEMEILCEVPEGMTLIGEGELLRQALLNLVENAIKYSPKGTRVTMRASLQAEEVRLEVLDQGEGIAQKEQERIFERFYRVDSSRHRETGGTGLGLSIVKRVALLHRGRVELTSHLGKGSSFRICLPKKE